MEQSPKYCANCKKRLDLENDSYEEMRYSYETEESPDVTQIGLVYICSDCSILETDILEESIDDEY